MPSRKSDARRSDASVSRLMSTDEDSRMTQDTPAPALAPETEPASTDADTDAPSLPSLIHLPPPPPQDKKDKDKDGKESVSIEDLNLPKSIITRLAKGVLPPNTQIQANAILALSKSATVFISHLASMANESTQASNKKTIMPADVFNALEEIECGFMRERLEAEFAKFNEIQTSKRSTYRKKIAAAKKVTVTDSSMISAADADVSGDMSAITADTTAVTADGSSPVARAAKKARVDPAAQGQEAGAFPSSSSQMEVDDDDGKEVSDAETVPDEQGDGEDEDEDDDEEEDEDEEDAEEEDENDDDEEEGDGLEEKEARESGDEALDDEESE